MAVLLGFAFVSGVITILSPCILPVLPVVLAAGTGQGKARPFGVMAGFVVSFTFFTLALTALVRLLGVPADALRWVAVVIIVLSGLVMVVPRLRLVFEGLVSGLANHRARSATPARPRSGFLGGIPIGLGLGLVWTPCVGPIMASVITLAFTQRVDGGAVLIAAAYTLGTSIPMLGVMLGGRTLLARVKGLTRNTGRIQQVFGALMVLVGVGIGLGWDRKIQSAILTAFPGYGAGLTALENNAVVQRELGARDSRSPTAIPSGADRVFSGVSDPSPLRGRLADFGAAPEIVTQGKWFNTAGSALDALAVRSGEQGSSGVRMEDLRGKVVMIDFWTYSCVNCVRTLPYLRAWHEAYRDDGLVIIGVHTPEFEFEKSPANLERAMRDLRVTWPVVQDNEYAQWTTYGNRYWPAHYFIDAAGRVRYYHFGEGEYDTSEKIIQELLREAGSVVQGAVSIPEKELEARTPETYLGFMRARRPVTDEGIAPGAVVDFHPSRRPANGEWSVTGRWIVNGEFVVPESIGTLELGFQARDVYLVVEPESEGARMSVSVDGAVPKDTPDVQGGLLTPTESRLYHLVSLERAGSHLLRLDVVGRLRLFAFTFG